MSATVKRGSQGPDVKRLQERLAALGYDPGPADGIFGGGTEAAVKRFQQDRGLTADGVVGPQTWAALDQAAPGGGGAGAPPPGGGAGGGSPPGGGGGQGGGGGSGGGSQPQGKVLATGKTGPDGRIEVPVPAAGRYAIRLKVAGNGADAGGGNGAGGGGEVPAHDDTPPDIKAQGKRLHPIRQKALDIGRTYIDKISEFPGPDGNKKGWQLLKDIYDTAYGMDIFGDAAAKEKIPKPHAKYNSWCGIYATACCIKAGVQGVAWKPGKGGWGPKGFAAGPLEDDQFAPGDVVVIKGNLVHHALLIRREGGTIWTLDGNFNNQTVVERAPRPASDVAYYYRPTAEVWVTGDGTPAPGGGGGTATVSREVLAVPVGSQPVVIDLGAKEQPPAPPPPAPAQPKDSPPPAQPTGRLRISAWVGTPVDLLGNVDAKTGKFTPDPGRISKCVGALDDASGVATVRWNVGGQVQWSCFPGWPESMRIEKLKEAVQVAHDNKIQVLVGYDMVDGHVGSDRATAFASWIAAADVSAFNAHFDQLEDFIWNRIGADFDGIGFDIELGKLKASHAPGFRLFYGTLADRLAARGKLVTVATGMGAIYSGGKAVIKESHTLGTNLAQPFDIGIGHPNIIIRPMAYDCGQNDPLLFSYHEALCDYALQQVGLPGRQLQIGLKIISNVGGHPDPHSGKWIPAKDCPKPDYLACLPDPQQVAARCKDLFRPKGCGFIVFAGLGQPQLWNSALNPGLPPAGTPGAL